VAKIYKLKQKPKPKAWYRLDEWKNDVQCFKNIPEVAWQIIDLSETTLILDNPRNVAPNIISDKISWNSDCQREPFALN
jgi:L-threonylcarbamoyladenylate synthase